eukprot:CAMPEP_0198262244 /NCGR_PEP_ID=MMETSP1447-20131203/10790_1 /TAXON_ID=420782 /ORGANISM="Chaetoceros dichaeta, Strain CCMP1751" /LENGTH=115 /DNA_ID=CAMNT_0043950417 /DNA_START=88 /DNA_END=435 /DNA_ORIENTATION=+
MSTGITVSEEVAETFMNFKLKKENCKGSNFLTFKINDKGKEIVLDKIADSGEGFEEFVEQLPEDDGLYGVIDVKYETSDNRSTSKMIFVSWVPDTMRIKKKNALCRIEGSIEINP